MLKMLIALQNRKARRGFTLIELLVVVAIIGLLAAFAVPKLFEAISKSKGAQGSADTKTVAAAFERYYFEKNKYPTPDGNPVDLTKSPPDEDETDLKEALAPFVKSSMKLYNGYGYWYYYATNAKGTGYVLIDYKDNADDTAITLSCNNSKFGTAGQPATLEFTAPKPTKVNKNAANQPALKLDVDDRILLSTCVDKVTIGASAVPSKVSIETN